MKLYTTILMAAMVSSPLLGQKSSRDLAPAKAAMADGLGAMQKGDLLAARRAFERVVKLAPQIETGHAALGFVMLSQNQLEGAVGELQTARRMAPGDLAVDLNLGRALAGLGRYEAALAVFRENATGMNPLAMSPEETLAYATALAGTKQVSAAIDVLSKAVNQAPGSGLLNDGLGTALAQAGRLQDALPYFQRAVVSEPSLGQAQLHLAAALLMLNRPEEAITPATAAVAAMPNNFDAELQLGHALSAVHRDTEALTRLHRAVEMATGGQSADALYGLAVALQASGDAKGALPLFSKVTASTGGTFNMGAALTNYALALVQTGDAAGALPLYAKALAAGPDTATLREDFGAAYLQKADLDDGVKQFKAGLEIEPDNAHLHYDLGLAYKLKDNLGAAVPEFERAAALDQTLPDPVYTLGVIYMQQGKYPEAISNLQRATALQPGNGDAWALLGGVLKNSGDAAGAAEALHHAIDLQPDQPSLHIQLATLNVQAGRTAEAAAERKIAADLSRAAMNKQRAEFALKSGRTLLEQNKVPEAIYQLTTAVNADPTLAEPHHLLATAYGRQGKTVDAALEEKQATKLGASTNHP